VELLGGRGCLGKSGRSLNNASVENTVAALDLELSDWDRVMNTNLRGAFICARAAARIMVQQGKGHAGVSYCGRHLEAGERIRVYAGERDVPGSGGVRAMSLNDAMQRLSSADA
jgi:NAD(P)-dependent dehydrogenase (short-subunit alcohol dehydrogenase family)